VEALILCENVSKIHPPRSLEDRARGFKAVDGVSLSIEKGSSFGLVGESGSGKTTLAKAIMYLDPPTEGSVRYRGIELASLPARALRAERKRMQIVFQDPHSSLDPRMRVRDSLAEGLVNLGVPRAERERRVVRLLDLVGMSASSASRYPHEFSTGQRQRLVIARALTMEPDFLVLDEPVSNLDVSIQAQVINLLGDIKQELGLTYLFISHDINLVAYMCDNIAVMYRGKIVEQAPTALLLSSPRNEYTAALLAATPGGAPRLA